MIRTICLGIILRPLTLIFFLALLFRLWFLRLMTLQLTDEQLVSVLTDWHNYIETAKAFLNGGTLEPSIVNIFGPGYPAFLAAISMLTGWHTIYALVVQCLLSSLCVFGIYYITKELLADRRTALVAALLLAISPLSISLANAFLSETFFTAALLGGLVLFVRGIKRGTVLPFLFSGVCFGVATLTRVQGLLLPFLLLLWVILSHWVRPATMKSYAPLLKGTLWLCLVAFGIAGAWTVHNAVVDDMPHVSRAVPGAFAKVGIHIAAKLNDRTWDEEKIHFDSLLTEKTSETTGPDFYKTYTDFSIDYFMQSFQRAPLRVVWLMIQNGITNMHSEGGISFLQLPEWGESIQKAEWWIKKKGLQYRVSLFTLIGLVLLWFRRQKSEGILFAALYLYIGGSSMFTLWQGDRIMYPAIIGWTPLVAVALLGGYDLIRGRKQLPPRRQNADTALPRHDTDLPHA